MSTAIASASIMTLSTWREMVTPQQMSGILVLALNALIIIGALVSAAAAVSAKKLISSVIALAATGSFIGLEFIMLQAPDVAIAEVSVGAVLSTVLYVIALHNVKADREDEEDPEVMKAAGAISEEEEALLEQQAEGGAQ